MRSQRNRPAPPRYTRRRDEERRCGRKDAFAAEPAAPPRYTRRHGEGSRCGLKDAAAPGAGTASSGPRAYSGNSALIESDGSKTLGSTSSKVTDSVVCVNSNPMSGMLKSVEVGNSMSPNSW